MPNDDFVCDDDVINNGVSNLDRANGIIDEGITKG
jgi:hypothetical protein